MSSTPIDVADALLETLAPLPATLYVQTPSDLLDHLPACIIEATPAVPLAHGRSTTASAVVIVTLNVLANRRTQAKELAHQAYQLIHASPATGPTASGPWISRVVDTAQPHIDAHTFEASTVFQYSTGFTLYLRQPTERQKS